MLKGFFRKVQFPIMLACGAAPICAVCFALLAPEFLRLAWLFPAAMVLFSLVCLLLPRKQLFIGLLLSFFYIVGGIWLVCLMDPNGQLTAVPILYGLLLMYTVPIASWSWHQEPPSILFVLGFLLHIAAQIGISFLNYREFYALEPIRAAMTVCFLVFTLTVLLSRSRSSLASAARENPVIPLSTRWKNVLIVLTFFLLITVLSCSTLLADGIMAALRGIGKLISIAFSQESSTEEMTSVSLETTRPAIEIPIIPHTSDTAAAWQAFFLALWRYLFPVIVFAFGVVVLILICKYSSVLFRKLNLLLQRYATSAAADYEDEITDIRDSADPENIPATAPVRLSFLQRRKLSPKEKIRYRYRQLKKRNPQWLLSSTARENLPQDTSSLYEEARYSDNPISHEDAAEFVTKTKRL